MNHQIHIMFQDEFIQEPKLHPYINVTVGSKLSSSILSSPPLGSKVLQAGARSVTKVEHDGVRQQTRKPACFPIGLSNTWFKYCMAAKRRSISSISAHQQQLMSCDTSKCLNGIRSIRNKSAHLLLSLHNGLHNISAQQQQHSAFTESTNWAKSLLEIWLVIIHWGFLQHKRLFCNGDVSQLIKKIKLSKYCKSMKGMLKCCCYFNEKKRVRLPD